MLALGSLRLFVALVDSGIAVPPFSLYFSYYGLGSVGTLYNTLTLMEMGGFTVLRQWAPVISTAFQPQLKTLML